MGRSPCCSKDGINRGAWTPLEDKILTAYIKRHGEGQWKKLPTRAGLKRCGKSCRLRWLNYLRPDIKRGNISHDEEELIIRLHNLLGNRWSLIAGRLPGRTDNEIKNYWNTNLAKKLPKPQRSSPPEENKVDSSSPEQLTKTSTGPSESAAATDGTKVIRTRASRCTSKLVIPSPTPLSPPIENSSTALNPPQPHVNVIDEKIDCSEVPEGQNFQETDHDHEIETATGGNNSDKWWENYDDFAVLPHDDTFFNDWPSVSSVNCLEEDNAIFDLDSFLLDSDEWPTEGPKET